VQAVHELLNQSGIKFVAGHMSTAVEASSFEQLFKVIEEANKKLIDMGVQRILTSIHIDYRLDKDITIESKLGLSK